MIMNMGWIDRTMRIMNCSAVVGYLIATGKLSGILAIVLGIFAVVFLVTSVIGFCPLYTVFGFSTCKRESCTGNPVAGGGS